MEGGSAEFTSAEGGGACGPRQEGAGTPSGQSDRRSSGDPELGGQIFRHLVDSGPDALVIVDEQGRIVFINIQAENLFGYGRAELNGQPIEVLIPGRYRGTHGERRAAYTHAPKLRPMGSGLELFGLRKDGSEFPVEISLSPIQIEGGVLIASAIRDISERRRAEAESKLASQRLFSAVESFHGALMLYDAGSRLVMCNSATRELFAPFVSGPLVGLSYEQLIDACLREGLFAPAVAGEELRKRLLAHQSDAQGPLDVLLGDGRTLRLTNRRTLEGGIVSTAIDISDDVEHEAELRAARAEAEAASSAKSEFLSSMSHELRTPLNAILGFAQLLQRDKRTPLSESQQEKLGYVMRGGEHLLRLIDDVLDLARIEAGRVMMSPEPVAVREVLDEVRQTLEPIATRAGIQLLVQAPPGDIVVKADRTRFKQILINFGSNALKYGKPGGNAEIRVELSEKERARLLVIDDGIGIPLDKQDKIFQPFQRAGQEAGPIEGTGIGLSITRRLAELMGGAVGFRSTPGEGSTFWLELPRHVQQAARADEVRVPVDSSSVLAARGDAFRVVYIEDNPSNIAFMEGVMDELPRVALTTVPNAEVGIELVRETQPHVVIMDINLPGMSGYEATRRLHEWRETQHIPVIALTAAAMLGDRKRLADAGFYRYLTKPVKVDELLEALAALLPEEAKP